MLIYPLQLYLIITVANKFESTHLKEAFQLSLLLLPPSNRRLVSCVVFEFSPVIHMTSYEQTASSSSSLDDEDD